MHYYQHHISDFNQATRHLTRIERSLYRDLIELYYDTEKPLTSDFNKLSRRVIASTPEEKEALGYVLDEFFTLTNEGYRQSRCDAEIEKYHNQSSAKSKAGKASAESRRRTQAPKEPTDVEQNSTDVEQNSTGVQQVFNKCSTNHKPITNNHKPITNNEREGGNPPNPPPNRKRFKPPSVDEVRKYQLARGSPIDPESFVDYYEANDWMRGKNKIKCWKAVFRTWEKREVKHAAYKPTNQQYRLSAVERVNENLQRKSEERRRMLESGELILNQDGALVPAHDGVVFP